MASSTRKTKEKIDSLIAENSIFGIDGSIFCKMDGYEMREFMERVNKLSEDDNARVLENLNRGYVEPPRLKAEDYPDWACDW